VVEDLLGAPLLFPQTKQAEAASAARSEIGTTPAKCTPGCIESGCITATRTDAREAKDLKKR